MANKLSGLVKILGVGLLSLTGCSNVNHQTAIERNPFEGRVVEKFEDCEGDSFEKNEKSFGESILENGKSLMIGSCLAFRHMDDYPRLVRKEIPFDESQAPEIHGYVSSTFANKYMFNGFVIGEGPVNQNLVNLSIVDNFIQRDSIDFGVWNNYDFGLEESVEVDFFGSYNFPVKTFENLVGGYSDSEFGDSVSVGMAHWNYPGETLGTFQNHDGVVTACFKHHSNADLKFDYLYVFKDKDTDDGHYFGAELSKRIPLCNSENLETSVTPFLHSCYGVDFYGNSGVLAITPGVKLDFEKDAMSVGVTAKYQNGIHKNVKDQFYFGVETGIGF